ncbi:hypothetical protein [Moorena producens]|uniref:hypothetical protein n=1 Tax=Moorena producens TaxID=1155739 RepID=UPI003C71645B
MRYAQPKAIGHRPRYAIAPIRGKFSCSYLLEEAVIVNTVVIILNKPLWIVFINLQTVPDKYPGIGCCS